MAVAAHAGVGGRDEIAGTLSRRHAAEAEADEEDTHLHLFFLAVL